ncbi:hypothetical protein ZWY2020_034934 [Hordeum vulgare]|nr:hypothetical protein ZWY2020_034934 [Hordeum vulgare]
MAAETGEAPRALSKKEQDIQMMLAADVHLGTRNCDFQMEHYAYKRHSDGEAVMSPVASWLWQASSSICHGSRQDGHRPDPTSPTTSSPRSSGSFYVPSPGSVGYLD